MKILLLGASGVIGTALEKVCKAKGIECIGLNHEDFEITDKQQLVSAIDSHAPDFIFNAVVFMGINPCEENPGKAFAVNATAVMNLAKICQEKNITLVQPSSHAVFNGNKDDYYTESDPVSMTSVYAASKFLSERFASDLCERHYIVRFPTIFGKRRNKIPGFADKVVDWLKEGREITIADDKIDSPTYSLDAAETIISILRDKKPYGLYHIANSGKTSYYDFTVKLAELLSITTKIRRGKDSDFPALGYKPLKTAVKSEKLPPLRSWEEALKDYTKEIKP